MIDLDDAGDGFLYGGFVIGIILLLIYLIFSRPVIQECEANGGVMVKSNGDAICIDKSALIQNKKEVK